jgi:hypothetical protein
MTLNNLGSLHANERRFAEARRAYEEALRIYEEFAATGPTEFVANVQKVRERLLNLSAL